MSETAKRKFRRRSNVRREEDRLLRKLINRHNQLFHIDQIITSEMNFDTLFEVIADQTNKMMESEKCSIFLIDDNDEHLTTFASTDLKRNEIRIPKDCGIAGWVFCNQIPLLVPDAYSDPRFFSGIDEMTGFHTRCMLCVPLINRKNECIGTLQALNKKGGSFTDEDREILTHLAIYITVALENSLLYEKIKTADEAKERVINHLSHELRTPLALLAGIFKVMEKRLQAGNYERLETIISRGQRNVKRLNELQEKVDDIMKQRPTEDKMRLISIIEDALNLADELDENTDQQYTEVLHLLKDRIAAIFKGDQTSIETICMDEALNGILNQKLPSNNREYPQIKATIEHGMSYVMDSMVLEKVLSGILKNAIENTPDEGLIEVTAASVGNEIRIDFRDYGIGITSANQQNILKGFFHTRATEHYASKMPYDFCAGGLGLDLMRMKVFGEEFGFSVDFESIRCKYIPQDQDTCPGKISACAHIKNKSECLSSGGTKFTLRFPTLRRDA
jgi:K+-sensing histidine kinase KdpD